MSAWEIEVKNSQQKARTMTLAASVILVVSGMTTIWAWGQLGRMACTAAVVEEPDEPVLYAAWQPAGAGHAMLFRSRDRGSKWQPLLLPGCPGRK